MTKLLLPFLIAGLTTGSVYALTAVGLVLTYKTSGIFNFAQGAIATIAAYLYYELRVEQGWPWPAAVIVCIFVLGPVLGLVMEQLARHLQGSPLADRVAATVGLLLVVQAGAVLIYGPKVRSVPQFLPQHEFHIGGTTITVSQIIVFAIGLAATGGLFVYFRVSRIGLAMRAVVDSPDLLDIAGTSPATVRRWAWSIGSIFACTSGVLIVPFINLDPTILTFLIIAAFGAAAIGRFTNLPLTYLGGLVVGVGAAICSKEFTSGLLSGLSTAFPFVVLFVVLLLSPRRRFVDRAVVRTGVSRWTAPWPGRLTAAIALLVFLVLVPHLSFVGFHLADWTSFLAFSITFMSLGLLTRTAGQVSLCQISFLAIGVSAFSHLTVEHHWPWGLALLASGIVAIPVGALLAIPAIRLSGLHLALATFGFGVLLQYMFYTEKYMFGDLGMPLTINRPKWLGISMQSDKQYYYLVLVFALLAALLVIGIDRSRLGRLLRASADSPSGLATSGTSVNVTRVLVFCLSAFLAAISGVLQGGAATVASGDAYQPLTSLVFFALVLISVGSTPWYAVIAAAGYALVPSYITGPTATVYEQLIFGVAAVLYAITPAGLRGLPPSVRALIDRIPAPRLRRSHDRLAASAVAEKIEPSSLRVDDVRVAFGGLVAVDGVNLEARTGQITGLIGPNGAGKTTTFNAVSGLVQPSRGRVLLVDHDLKRRTPSARARLGIGRTFQTVELFDSMTVRENVELGCEAGMAGRWFWRHLMSSPPGRRRTRAVAAGAITLCGIDDIADEPVASLATGHRRLVELARCLAGTYRVMLLDEPSSGLDRYETERFGEVLQQAVVTRGVGFLLVEHDMALVSQICDYVYVLDFGVPIFEGTAAEVLSSPIVQTAYLGQGEIDTDHLTARRDLAVSGLTGDGDLTHGREGS